MANTQFLTYFLSPPISTLTPQDNLLLFISDHGMPRNNTYTNNCIDLWHFNGQLINNFYDDSHLNSVCLSKDTLKSLLDDLPAKHIVFEMSQCFSGGFQQMAVTWQNGYPSANPKICGFTAAMPDHYASGCTGDANGPSYQGYERSFNEWYTGMSIPTGQRLRKPAANIWAAHKAAILEDMTADTPISTSDYYLLQWADAIHAPNFISRIPNYKPDTIKKIFANYQHYLSKNSNSELTSFTSVANQFNAQVMAKYPKDKAFFQLDLVNQEQYLKNQEQEQIIAEISQKYAAQQDLAYNLYRDVILPVWEPAVARHEISLLSPADYRFESELYLAIMNKQNNLNNNENWYMFKIFYFQYLALTNNDPELVKYHKNCYQLIANWAESKQLPAIARASNWLEQYDNNREKIWDKVSLLEQEKQLLKRAYLYRRVIAAWITLSEIKDRQALAELNALITCQHEQ